MVQYFFPSKSIIVFGLILSISLTIPAAAEISSTFVVPPPLLKDRSSSEAKPKGEPAEEPSLDLIIPNDREETLQAPKIEGELPALPEFSDKIKK